MFECNIAHRRSGAVLCMLYKSRCNPMHPLNDVLPGPYAVPWSHIGIRMYVPPRCGTSHYRRTFVSSQFPSETILLTPCSMVWDYRVSRAGPMHFYWPKLLYPYYFLYCRAGEFRTDRVYISLFSLLPITMLSAVRLVSDSKE